MAAGEHDGLAARAAFELRLRHVLVAGDDGDDFAERGPASRAGGEQLFGAVGVARVVTGRGAEFEHGAEQVVGGAVDAVGQAIGGFIRNRPAERVCGVANDAMRAASPGGASCSAKPQARRLRRSGGRCGSALIG